MPRSQPPRILVVTDQEPALQGLTRLVGTRGYLVASARTGDAALEAAHTPGADLVILDEMLPDHEGLALSRALRQIDVGTPILMTITGRASPARHLHALRAGVWEFIAWPMNETELASKIDYYILDKLDADRARAAAKPDAATGLASLRGLTQRAQQLAVQAYHHHAPMACVVLSPDDAAATTLVGRALRAHGRRSDAIGRLAATEFAVVAAGADVAGAERLASRLADAVRRAAHSEGVDVPSLHAGFHAVPNVHYAPVEPLSLVSQASASLRRARTSGPWLRGSQTGD